MDRTAGNNVEKIKRENEASQYGTNNGCGGVVGSSDDTSRPSRARRIRHK